MWAFSPIAPHPAHKNAKYVHIKGSHFRRPRSTFDFARPALYLWQCAICPQLSAILGAFVQLWAMQAAIRRGYWYQDEKQYQTRPLWRIKSGIKTERQTALGRHFADFADTIKSLFQSLGFVSF